LEAEEPVVKPAGFTQSKKIAVLVDQCKPESVDAISLVIHYNRVFLGYPLIKKDMEIEGKINSDSYNLNDLVFDSGSVTYDSNALSQDGSSIKEQLAKNIVAKYKNYVKSAGSLIKIISNVKKLLNDGYKVYALIYRPPFTYVGIIDSWDFKDPKTIKYNGKILLEAYKGLWKDKNWRKDLASHIAHMALAFKIKEGTLKQVSPILPLSEIMIRPQAKLIKSDRNKDSCEWIDNIYNKIQVSPRLVESLTSTGLEVLCCELLNLEYKEQVWFHSGGMGDLGIDGFGMHDNEVVGVLQCKKNIDKKELDKLLKSIKTYIDSLKLQESLSPRIYIGTLSKIDKKEDNNYIILDADKISELIEKHKENLFSSWKWLRQSMPKTTA